MTGGPDLALAGLRMLGGLAVLTLLLVGALYLARRLGGAGTGMSGGELQILGSRAIGTRERITLVKIPGAVLVLGVTRERIALLDRITDSDRIEALDRSAPAPDFAGAFRRALGRVSAPKEPPR